MSRREISPAVVLQRSVNEERVQLLGGRFAALGTHARGERDDEDGDEPAAEVDAPGFQSNQRRGQQRKQEGEEGQRGICGKYTETDDVLDASTSEENSTPLRRGWNQGGGLRSGRQKVGSSLLTGAAAWTGLLNSGVQWRAQGRCTCWDSCNLRARWDWGFCCGNRGNTALAQQSSSGSRSARRRV